ncbi:DNA methyltransferase [Streptomyces bambusae]|uniref:type ISP restriction/modification enzyme n=1 Tax=Streptomyces bambusae TaxID=1550616 RepID=UPI001CFD791C|nr:type ISP restriction/modification enzyme [Streptomyces bambusae]MCB5167124.1 DNA methyltransferase [Streptomyces bambusae]
MRAVSDDAPLLDDLFPWSVAPLRLGRPWVLAPDARTLRDRWAALTAAEGTAREELFLPSRARSPHSGAAALPGQRTSTGRFAQAPGPCPEPVRVLADAFDAQWLLPDHRLIDAARPELWRVWDEQQVFLVETGAAAVPLAASPLLPAGRTGRIRPLHRRPGGAEPNVAPGLLDLLGERYHCRVTPEDLLSWALAAARPGPRGTVVPLPAAGETWRTGLLRGHRLLRIQLAGARGDEPPKLPGGSRPYVRAAVPERPAAIGYDAEAAELRLGPGVVSPVPAEVWEFEAGGVRVLERWFAARTGHREAAGLAALGPAQWPQQWTSELLALVTSLALLTDPATAGETGETGDAGSEWLGVPALKAAGVLPVPAAARRPASVLDHQEEGPEGQFALL